MPKITNKVKVNGEMIREAIVKAGKNNRDVAKELGRSHDHVSKIIRDGKCIKSDVIAICALLGIKLDDVLHTPTKKDKTLEELRQALTQVNELKKTIQTLMKEMEER